jgi:hypothetical protein
MAANFLVSCIVIIVVPLKFFSAISFCSFKSSIEKPYVPFFSFIELKSNFAHEGSSGLSLDLNFIF